MTQTSITLPVAADHSSATRREYLGVCDLVGIVERLGLRDYQRDAVRAALEHRSDTARVHVLDIPTGAGKNRTGIALVASLMQGGRSVVWIAKNWELLEQTSHQLAALLPEYAGELRRIGGDDSVLRHLPAWRGGRIFFTTLATWNARRGHLPWRARPSRDLAVVWDEVHWAVDSPMGRQLRNRHRDRDAVVYGLTATPVVGPGVHVVYSIPFEELSGTVLARPRIRDVSTGTAWDPELLGEDFTPASLRDLGRSRRRNRAIVDELVRGLGEGRYRRTLIFACDIAHAERLDRLIGERGIPSRVVHSGLGRRERDDAIQGFRRGRHKVLVNVAMLTEGIDIPEIDSVFLARPTCSRILLTQMIGRGTRRAPGKDSFWVVEFTDNLRRLEGQVVRARDVSEDGGAPGAARRSGHWPFVRHAEAAHPPRFDDVAIPGSGTVPIAVGQTFGVEIELTAPDGMPWRGPAWERTARVIIARLRETTHAGVHPASKDGEHDPTRWAVKYDSSAGWEVVSPILADAEGLLEMQRACDGLTDLVAERPDLLRLNHHCGLHLTLATKLDTDERLRGFLKRVQRLEPALFTLTGPSRLFPFSPRRREYARRAGNRYCRPVRGLGDVDRLQLAEFMQDEDNRYHTVNLTRRDHGIQLLEVRMHGGTTEFRKVALWTSLWMQIFNRSRYEWAGRGRGGPVFRLRDRPLVSGAAAREDIVEVLGAEGIPLTPEFAGLLRARRRELRERWRRVLPARVESWERAGWYD